MRKNQAGERIGGSLVNIVLGALILWVGQTCFHHAGQLASVDERFDSVRNQFGAVDARHESLRRRLEQVTSNTNERTRSRFTREDGDKLDNRIKELHTAQTDLERKLTKQITDLQGKLIALETHGNDSQEMAALRAEIYRLRAREQHWAGEKSGYYPQQASRTGSSRPTHLPPLNQQP